MMTSMSRRAASLAALLLPSSSCSRSSLSGCGIAAATSSRPPLRNRALNRPRAKLDAGNNATTACRASSHYRGAARTEGRRATKGAAAVREAPPAAAAAKSGLTVVEASVCRNLVTSGNWRCAPLTSPVAAGPLVFYTRIKSDRNTKVQHRWYRGNELRRSSDLAIMANPGSGYGPSAVSPSVVLASGESSCGQRTARCCATERFTVR